MSAEPLPLGELEAAGHLHAARTDLDQALELVERAAHNIQAAHQLQPRDKKGRPLHSSALRLWGALNALSSATRAMRTARNTCTTFTEDPAVWPDTPPDPLDLGETTP